MRIGIDLMGSDQPPQAIFEAVLQVGKECESVEAFVVFAHHDVLPDLKRQYLSYEELSEFHESIPIEFSTVSETIAMDESPLLAVRRKKNSSMAVGMRTLKEKKIDAFVSTGNTGALIATAILHLRLLPTIKRPALLVSLPTETGSVAVLDVGANISFKPEHLIDYAHLGMLYREAADGIHFPKVGLLNIGVEEGKGTKIVKEAYAALQDYFLNQRGKKKEAFLGNIEGREVFQGKVDVLITDGFTGNVFLKTAEGASSFLMEYLEEHFGHQATDEVRKIFLHLYQKFNYSEHPGALLCGIDGLVIKCHGYSDERALINGIKGAIHLVHKKVIEKMKAKL